MDDAAAGVNELHKLEVMKSTWIKRTGQIIRESKSLYQLSITICPDDKNDTWLGELLEYVLHNRSISTLDIGFEPIASSRSPYQLEWDIFHVLTPFIENNSKLRHLNLFHAPACMLSSLALVLSNCNNKRLEGIGLYGIETGGVINKIFLPLAQYTSLNFIGISGRGFGTEGCNALSKLIQDPTPRQFPFILELTDDSLNDDCITILCNILIQCNFVKIISLAGHSEMTVKGWETFFDVFHNSKCTVEELHLYRAGIDDELVAYLGDVLVINKSLKLLNLSCNEAVTLDGWQKFLKCTRNPELSLGELLLSKCNIDDRTTDTLVQALAGNTQLKRLELESNQITSRGLTTVIKSLINCELALEDLSLQGNININFGELAEDVLRSLSRTLCDKASIDRTFCSNHILYSIELDKSDSVTYDWQKEIWDDVYDSLNMNSYGYYGIEYVAREKILCHHFTGKKTDINVFVHMSETILPFAIEWIGRYSVEFSLMYQFVGGFPTVFNFQKWSTGATVKRKYPH